MLIDKLPFLYDRESVRGWKLMKAVGALIVGVIVLIYLIVQSAKPADHLVKTGVQVEARIMDTGYGPGGAPTISYTFYAGGGNYGAEKRPVADLIGVEPKGTITVWYDPKHPYDCITQNELRGHKAGSRTSGIFITIAVLAGIVMYIGLLLRKPPDARLCD